MFWDFQRDSYVAYQLSRTGEPYLPIDRVGGFTPDVSIRTPIFRAFDAQVEVSRGPVAIFAEGSAVQYQSQRQGLLLGAIDGEPLAVAGVIPPAQKSDGLRLDWLASYKPTPGTMVFFGYGASFVTDRTLSLANLQRMSDGFFLKVAYLLRK